MASRQKSYADPRTVQVGVDIDRPTLDARIEQRVHQMYDAGLVDEVARLLEEGLAEGRWVLLDYGEIVVHVQHEEERMFYALERLWRDCPVIELPADVAGPASPSGAPDGG